MPSFKKIGVCHGKTCGPAGAAKIKKILEDTYRSDGVEVVERLCCGRCDDHNSIVVDDAVTVSHLSPDTLSQKFISRPDAAIADAKTEEEKIQRDLDAALEADLLA
ncbi:hypothetical protein HY627_01705 [Candidatus Uhrbacteria bacterium]|nr:hypothetical protein [Candidatus Uhrbacteria bacterium]